MVKDNAYNQGCNNNKGERQVKIEQPITSQPHGMSDFFNRVIMGGNRRKIHVRIDSEEKPVSITIAGACNHAGAEFDTWDFGRGPESETHTVLVCEKCGMYAMQQIEETEDGVETWFDNWQYQQ